MKYYIGIDGGGSKTEAILCDEDGNVLKHTVSVGSNPIGSSVEDALSTVEKLIMYSLKCVDKENIEYISIGVPGLKKNKEGLSILRNFKDRYIIDGDEMNAFYGALSGEFGVVLLSGTGSFAMGMNKDGKMFTSGGWGPVTGDEGSGYFMGVQALKAVMNEYDNMGDKTVLTEMIKSLMKINDINELKKVLYDGSFKTRDIASLSKLVKYGAEQNDKVCECIIGECAKKLFLLADAVIKKLDMENESCDISLTGGIKNFGTLIIEPLREMIESRYLNIVYKDPVFSPIGGSIIWCFKEDHKKFSLENRENLKKSIREVHIDVI